MGRLRIGRVQLYIEPRDIWVGVYVARDAVYVCPLPLVVIRWDRVPATQAASGSRPCGCRWYRRGDGAVVFTKRCEQHDPMCRSLEPWELEITATGSKPSGGESQ